MTKFAFITSKDVLSYKTSREIDGYQAYGLRWHLFFLNCAVVQQHLTFLSHSGREGQNFPSKGPFTVADYDCDSDFRCDSNVRCDKMGTETNIFTCFDNHSL